MDDNDRKLLLAVSVKLDEILTLFHRFRPLLERYEAASQAGSLLKARKVMKG